MEEDEPQKKSSAMGTIIGVVVATLLAVVLGGGGGVFMAQSLGKADDAEQSKKSKQTKVAKKAGKDKSKDKNSAEKKGSKKKGDKDKEAKAEDDGEEGEPALPPQRVNLAAITTNLAKPKGTWIRLEASIMPSAPLPENHTELVAQIQEDLLGFLRTVRLSQIQGPSGFQHMREDLNERVKIRSKGAYGKLLIHALLVE